MGYLDELKRLRADGITVDLDRPLPDAIDWIALARAGVRRTDRACCLPKGATYRDLLMVKGVGVWSVVAAWRVLERGE